MCVCVCMVSVALITAMVLCVKSRDSLLSVLMRRVGLHAVFSPTGFKGRGKPCHKTCSHLKPVRLCVCHL